MVLEESFSEFEVWVAASSPTLLAGQFLEPGVDSIRGPAPYSPDNPRFSMTVRYPTDSQSHTDSYPVSDGYPMDNR